MSLQKYKNSSFDLPCPATTAVAATNANSHNGNCPNSQLSTLNAGQLDEGGDQVDRSAAKPDYSLVQKPLSFSNLIKSKFKRAKSQHKLKGKKSNEQKSMVRSISIAFNDDAYASQKSNLQSISNLYLNAEATKGSGLLNDSTRSNLNDSNSSTNLANDDGKSSAANEHPQAKKSNKLQKLREKFRSKFKLKANSLEDRSATDLDDSLEQQPDSEEPSDEIAEHSAVSGAPFNGGRTTSGRILDLFDSDLDALSTRTKASLKLRPKSEMFADQQLRDLNKTHRFTTIEASLNLRLLNHNYLNRNFFFWLLDNYFDCNRIFVPFSELSKLGLWQIGDLPKEEADRKGFLRSCVQRLF